MYDVILDSTFHSSGVEWCLLCRIVSVALCCVRVIWSCVLCVLVCTCVRCVGGCGCARVSVML